MIRLVCPSCGYEGRLPFQSARGQFLKCLVCDTGFIRMDKNMTDNRQIVYSNLAAELWDLGADSNNQKKKLIAQEVFYFWPKLVEKLRELAKTGVIGGVVSIIVEDSKYPEELAKGLAQRLVDENIRCQSQPWFSTTEAPLNRPVCNFEVLWGKP